MLPALHRNLGNSWWSYFLRDHGVYSTKKIRSQFQNIRNITPPDLFIFIAKRLFTFTYVLGFVLGSKHTKFVKGYDKLAFC